MTDTTSAAGSSSEPRLRVLLYSDDANTREQVILALGRRPRPDLPELEYVEVATEPVVIANMDAGGILWGSGDVVGLTVFGVLFVQWVRSSMQEARREDRRLDRLERTGVTPTTTRPTTPER